MAVRSRSAARPEKKPSAAPQSPGGPRLSARFWWTLHHWVGLKLSILMSFVLLTGTLAVFSHEIDWLVNPTLRAPASETIAWEEMADGAAKAVPGGTVRYLFAPHAKGFAATALVTHPEGGYRIVYADPGTGAIQGTGPFLTVQRTLRFLHRHLMLPAIIGVPIVAALSIPLLISLLTSLFIYKKWWRGFSKPPRWRNARTWFGDFHRLAGVWCLWFTTLMAVTGLWYLVESLGGRAPALASPEIPPVDISSVEAAAQLPDVLAAARDAYPQLDVARIRFPIDGIGAFAVQGAAGPAVLVGSDANAVWLTGDPVQVQLVSSSAELTLHQRISQMADPLHFGTLGGFWTRLIWFGFGTLLTALSISGAAIYSLRLLRSTDHVPSLSTVLGTAWHGMRGWRWPASAFVGASFILLALRILS